MVMIMMMMMIIIVVEGSLNKVCMYVLYIDNNVKVQNLVISLNKLKKNNNNLL